MNRQNPEELIRKGDSKLKPGLFGKLFSSDESRAEEAVELYEQAANIYKINKDWTHAGEAYEKAARLEEGINSDTAANHYQEAAHCFSFTDKPRSTEMTDYSIRCYENKGKFMQAAKITQNIAHDYEVDFDYPAAIIKYRKAAELFKSESANTKSQEQACLLKVADLLCISNANGMFDEAPEIYEKIGMQYLTVPLLKSSAKDLFFKNVVCYLAKKDEVTADIQLKKFMDEDPTFCDTREQKFLSKVIECLQDPPNPEEFKIAVNGFRAYRDFDKWRLNMFAAVLKTMENDEEDLK